MPLNHSRGYSLAELMVAVSLFAFVMMLSSGSYIMMISINRQAQSLATGINSLSFALETMARTIRTGSTYCGSSTCNSGGSGDSFDFLDKDNHLVRYTLSGSKIRLTDSTGSTYDLTDPSVIVTSLAFYPEGTATYAGGDSRQARVSIIITGNVPYGPGKTQTFTVETLAVMRGTDL